MPKTIDPYSDKPFDEDTATIEPDPVIESYEQDQSFAGKVGEGARSAIGTVGESAKYAADKTAESAKYAADKVAGGAKYAARKAGDGARSAGEFVRNNPVKTAAAIGGVAVAAGAAIAGAKAYRKQQATKGGATSVDKRSSSRKAKAPKIDPQAE